MGKIIGSPVFRQHNPATFIRVSMLQVHPASSSFHSTMIILRRSLSVDSAESPMATLRWGWDLWVAGGDFCGGLSKRSHWIWILFGSRTCSVPFIHFHPFSCIFIHFSSVVSLDIRQGPDRLPSQPRPLPMRTGGRLQPQLTQPGQRSGACCGILWCNWQFFTVDVVVSRCFSCWWLKIKMVS